jgi:hypothetical protein
VVLDDPDVVGVRAEDESGSFGIPLAMPIF